MSNEHYDWQCTNAAQQGTRYLWPLRRWTITCAEANGIQGERLRTYSSNPERRGARDTPGTGYKWLGNVALG